MELIKKLNEKEAMEVAKKEWHDERMQEYLVKKYDFYKTNDDIIIEVEKASSLSIDKTIWYDDELPAEMIPTACFETFILENIHHCNRYDCYSEELKRNSKFYFCNQGNTTSYIDYDRGLRDVVGIIREIKPQEMEEILQIYKERKENYLIRLERYFKRYGNKISVQGYWRDR